jgi:hypothetical protein
MTMPTIHAWQHIYSNVEKEQSPHRRGGFQTLFYTHTGLSEAEVSEMEGRLLYFPSEIEPVKHLFFVLSTGKGVVAQIVVLPEPDQLGRKGRYLAHSLIFAPDSLAQFEADPFRVFRRFRFITNVSEALAQGNFQTGDLPPVALELPPEASDEVEAARAWSAPELKKLALLALQADRQASNREAVTFAGEPAQIESALEAAFLVVPIRARPRCTFDTYFYRCNLVATYFWAVGLPEPPVAIKFALVETQQRQVQGHVPPEPVTPYERWALAIIEAGQLAEMVRHRDDAWAISAWLSGQETDSTRLDSASPELSPAVFKADPPAVHNLLRNRVGKQLPPALVQRVADHLHRHTAEASLYQYLRQGFALPQLLESLYESYAADQFKTPPRQEVKALAELLKTANHELLRLLLACWRDPDKDLPSALDQASEAAYRQFGENALRLKLINPLSLLRPGRGRAFLDFYLTTDEIDWVELSEALVEANETSCLALLADRVSRLSGKDLKQLTQLMKDQPDIPASFRTAVEQANAAQPAEGGLKNLVQAVWRRLPGQK